jgi:5'(3')-deoxyribonucleotidase
MGKPIIAIDIDDVLADTMEAVRLTVNQQFGVNLQPEHYEVPGQYWGYYESVWSAHGLSITFDDLSEDDIKQQYRPHLGAREAIAQLSKRYAFIAITSRNESWKQLTEAWLEEYFPGMIQKVHFAGNKEHVLKRSKGEVSAEIGAEWLIDDNPEHCSDAIVHGVKGVLFGNYGWQHTAPEGVICCKDWAAVLEYLDGIS